MSISPSSELSPSARSVLSPPAEPRSLSRSPMAWISSSLDSPEPSRDHTSCSCKADSRPLPSPALLPSPPSISRVPRCFSSRCSSIISSHTLRVQTDVHTRSYQTRSVFTCFSGFEFSRPSFRRRACFHFLYPFLFLVFQCSSVSVLSLDTCPFALKSDFLLLAFPFIPSSLLCRSLSLVLSPSLCELWPRPVLRAKCRV